MGNYEKVGTNKISSTLILSYPFVDILLLAVTSGRVIFYVQRLDHEINGKPEAVSEAFIVIAR